MLSLSLSLSDRFPLTFSLRLQDCQWFRVGSEKLADKAEETEPEGLIALWILLDSIPCLGQSVPPASESANDFSRLSRCSIPYPLVLHLLSEILPFYAGLLYWKSSVKSLFWLLLGSSTVEAIQLQLVCCLGGLEYAKNGCLWIFFKPRSTAAADLAMWKQAEASRDARKSTILGMHSIVSCPMVVGGDIVPRPMMYIALTYDHRLIDGREAVFFLRRIKDVVEDPRRLLLDI
ncbi:hypothetical protein RHGRI_018660 [Rhododendron griersonianum]|uniref:dihydrolipoyllysine-residue succinyltransferase n=1 Tax=Rhododendron griersonianum TaxID=479676 RepID=A0AAV6K292_9ERIC|nr:hypothetical protein RHGRI_018660 [Rhododendron griersonianum]